MNSEYGEWKLVKSQFSQLFSAVAVFKKKLFTNNLFDVTH